MTTIEAPQQAATQAPRRPAAPARKSVEDRIDHLSAVSARKLIEPEEAFDWSTLSPGRVLPDELTSIVGLDLDLTEEQRARLTREEVASMLIAGTRFEAVLNATFSFELARSTELTDSRHHYMLHEVGEETRHQRAFLRLIEQLDPKARNPLDRGIGRFVRGRIIASVMHNPALFCVLLLAGEEIPDLLQKLACEHPDTDELIRAVNRYHRQEEARRLAFARLVLPERWRRAVARRALPGAARRAVHGEAALRRHGAPRCVPHRRLARLQDVARRQPHAGAHRDPAGRDPPDPAHAAGRRRVRPTRHHQGVARPVRRRRTRQRRRLVGEVDDQRRVVGGQLALAGVAVDDRPRDSLGDGRGREHVVDPHAAVLVEVAGAVVPVACRAGRRPDTRGGTCLRVPTPRARATALRSGSVTCVAPTNAFGIPDVAVGGRDVEVAAAHERVGRARNRAAIQSSQRLQPVQLALVELGTDLAPVRHVHADEVDAAARRGEERARRPRTDRRAVGPKPVDGVLDADARQDRHAVPLALAVVHRLVAERRERERGERSCRRASSPAGRARRRPRTRGTPRHAGAGPSAS